MSPGVTVGVLLYGDHPRLAARCLGPLWPLQRAGLVELRVGCNECGPETLAYVQRMVAAAPETGLVVSAGNAHKYPMMRHLLALAPPRPTWMWFDDDSYFDAPDPTPLVRRAAERCAAGEVVGQVWTMRLGGNQHLWVRDQPWYAGKPVARGDTVRFCQGAWWAAPAALLARHDWPVPELERKGGDVMLGELCRQQGVPLHDVGHAAGVRINADAQGRHSKMPTRGPLPVPRPVGWDYAPGPAARVAAAVGDAP